MGNLGQILFRLLVVAVLCFLFWNFARVMDRIEEPMARRPAPRPSQELAQGAERRSLPQPSVLDPSVGVEMTPCEDACTGTAFAIDGSGNWLTAMHVVDDCAEVGLMDRGRIRPVTEVVLHPAADIGLLRTAFAAPPLALNDQVLRLRQDGFHFGFPRAEPGAVHGRLIGRMRLRATGQRRFTAPAIAWAEVSRVPHNDKPLGGLSGGAVLDEKGAVIGIAIAASERRGRVISAAPQSIAEMLQMAGVKPDAARAGELRGAITERNYDQVGKQMRSALTVAQVICLTPGYLKKRRARSR